MGVLNVTPDSFSDGGEFFDTDAAVSHALRMAEEGAAFIDVGGESTRPGAAAVGADEELRRVIPVIERLRGAKQRADLHTNLLGQAVLSEFGRRGWLDKWIRRTRKHYAMKLEFTRAAMARHFPPEAQCTFPEGGMAVWVELPPALDAAELLVKAQDQGGNFAPSRYFYFQQPRHNAFRLCFTTLPNEQIEKGLGILGSLLRTEVRKAGLRRKSVAMANVALV
jgi:aspartate/methionine/tyrosine aminotransferase